LKGSIPRTLGVSNRRILLGGLALLAAGWPSLHAQAPARTGGQVVRVSGTDTLPVAGVRVVLHRIGQDRQGPVDSVVTSVSGRFRFHFPADTAALHILSARHSGIEYFSTPISAAASAPDTALQILVADTASDAPLVVAQRHLVIPVPDRSGRRHVVDLVLLANRGTRTRVAATPEGAVWEIPTPPGATGVHATPESDVSQDALEVREGSIRVLAPIAPGEKQLLIEYDLGPRPGEVTVPLTGPIDTLTLLLEESSVELSGLTLTAGEEEPIEGRTFRRWAGAVGPDGATLTLRFRDGLSARAWMLLLVGGTILFFAALAVALIRRRHPAVASAPGARPPRRTVELLDRMADLDAEYAGREATVSPERWAGYQAERALLKREVEARLAAPSRRP